MVMFHGQNNLSESNLPVSKINLLKKKKQKILSFHLLMLFKRIYKATALLDKILKFQLFRL